jgi:nitronate monooxygenase
MSTSSFTEAEFAAFLNRMLEAERAGAKALLVYMEDHPRNDAAWTTLRKVQGDEAHNCVLLGEQLKRRGQDYSHATGEFFDKAVAVKGRRARIEFLVRGLRWAVREFEQALPRMSDGDARKVFESMRASHLRSIAACEDVARSLKD